MAILLMGFTHSKDGLALVARITVAQVIAEQVRCLACVGSAGCYAKFPSSSTTRAYKVVEPLYGRELWWGPSLVLSSGLPVIGDMPFPVTLRVVTVLWKMLFVKGQWTLERSQFEHEVGGRRSLYSLFMSAASPLF